ncbi:cationic outer membrane protein OmpH [Deinococcus malanensis]|uniref:Cationic outer membrane protein OmpH n=1 Tax=Deinococcus malanensis TaxID=1706855 RepID=A0ABQ2EYM8_9DEIO|nr:OmpH family outer membrane protein [Deinococcus malanensis]GGK32408.1 cationic outer membrane protein OmpH [Deinococcus malanensis]
MKMNAKVLAPLAVVAAFGLGTVTPNAQTPAQKIGFVDVAKLITSHSGNKDIQDIQKKADAELGELDKQIKAIDAKGANATPTDKDKRTQLISTIQAKAKAYDAQLQPKVSVVEKAVDTAIGATAKSNGFSIVMDRNVAARSGLVVYADDNTDLTAAAAKAVK